MTNAVFTYPSTDNFYVSAAIRQISFPSLRYHPISVSDCSVLHWVAGAVMCVSFRCHSYMYHYVNDDGVIFLCITDDVSRDLVLVGVAQHGDLWCGILTDKKDLAEHYVLVCFFHVMQFKSFTSSSFGNGWIYFCCWPCVCVCVCACACVCVCARACVWGQRKDRCESLLILCVGIWKVKSFSLPWRHQEQASCLCVVLMSHMFKVVLRLAYRFLDSYKGSIQTALPFAMNSEFSNVLKEMMVSGLWLLSS